MLGDHLNNVNPTDSLQRVHFAVMLFRYYDPVVPINTSSPSIRQVGLRTFVLHWNSVDGVDGYQVRMVGGDWENFSVTDYKRARFSDLLEGTTYTVEIRTLLEYENTSLYSDVVSVTGTTLRYDVYIDNYFDSGYVVRYYGSDSNAKRSEAENDIADYVDAVVTRFETLFPMEVTDNTPMYVSSPIDDCKGTVTTSNVDSLCNHANPHTICYNDTYPYLEPNPNTLYGFMYDNYSLYNDPTKVFWSGHRIQFNENSPNSFNRSSSVGKFVFMLGLFEDNVDFRIKSCLMHELSHQLGAPDHYHECEDSDDLSTCKRAVANGGKGYCSNESCNLQKGTINRPDSCIMDGDAKDIESVNVFCEGCKADILIALRGGVG